MDKVAKPPGYCLALRQLIVKNQLAKELLE
jgi:hypothetical protein